MINELLRLFGGNGNGPDFLTYIPNPHYNSWYQKTFNRPSGHKRKNGGKKSRRRNRK
jgi:hypothetical protein